MTRKTSGSIPEIPGTVREQKESKRKDAVKVVRGSERQSTQGSKCVPQLQPIRAAQGTKLPPLKETLLPSLPEKGNRLPDIGSQAKKHSLSRGHERTPDVLTPTGAREYKRKRNDRLTIPAVNSDEEDADSDSSYIFKDYDQTRPNIRDSLDKYTYETNVDDNITKHSIKWQNKDERPAWFEEREKLRRHKRQAEAKQTALKPLKATLTFKEKNQKPGAEPEKGREHNALPINERADRNVSMQRRSRDKTDPESLDCKNGRAPPSTTNPTSGSSGKFRAGALGPLTPRGTECSTKGLGFRSKSRLAKLRVDEEERLEQERRERERTEAKLPKKIRKDLKKYGFNF